jgi:hypothetical protein
MEKLIQQRARYNTATATGDTTLNIGVLLLVNAGVSPPSRNTNAAVNDAASADGWTLAAGTPLPGTWKSCGLVGSAILMQRVA